MLHVPGLSGVGWGAVRVREGLDRCHWGDRPSFRTYGIVLMGETFILELRLILQSLLYLIVFCGQRAAYPLELVSWVRRKRKETRSLGYFPPALAVFQRRWSLFPEVRIF